MLNEGADEEKRTNEIGAFIPMMDEIPDIAGRTVTVDAMLTQKEIAAYLHGRGADYMFVAKGNHPGMFEVLTEWAEREIARPADHVDEPGRPAHGRLEKREIWVSAGPLHLIPFPWAGQVFAVRRTVRQYRCAKAGRPATVGRPSVEIVVGITSHTAMSADAEQLLRLNRGHWTIEAMHRVLDEPTGWNEDHSRIRSGRGSENMSCLRRFAIRVIRAHADLVAPTLRRLARNPRLMLDYLRLTGNHRKRAPA
ncbi:MAG: ISAs1 family transposase [Alphaproteobacteria bacterium]|nr:ISAs1 family transposase [Alphaproteobacteria bacterium]